MVTRAVYVQAILGPCR